MKVELIAETEEEARALAAGAIPAGLVRGSLGMVAARIGQVAVRLRIFEHLAGAPMEAPALAARLGLDEAGVAVLLDALEAFGSLERGPRGFAPTPEVRRFLLERAPESVLAHARFDWDQWALLEGLEARLKTPLDVHIRPPAEGFWARYLDALDETAAPVAAAVAAALVGRGPEMILDVGGGLGTYARAFLERLPDATATVLELRAAVELRMGVERGPSAVQERLTMRAGDARVAGALGAGAPWDLIIMANVLPHFTAGEAAAMVSRARSALAPEGCLVLVQPDPGVAEGAGEGAQVRAAGRLLYVLMTGRGLPGRRTLGGWLSAAGFGPAAELHGDGLGGPWSLWRSGERPVSGVLLTAAVR